MECATLSGVFFSGFPFPEFVSIHPDSYGEELRVTTLLVCFAVTRILSCAIVRRFTLAQKRMAYRCSPLP
jgi:hypothetical protein